MITLAYMEVIFFNYSRSYFLNNRPYKTLIKQPLTNQIDLLGAVF